MNVCSNHLAEFYSYRDEHQFLLTASFPHVFESCLKFRKGREYIKSMYLVKLTVKLTLDLILPELLCCYQENHIELGSKSKRDFEAGIVVLWKFFILFQFCEGMKQVVTQYY